MEDKFVRTLWRIYSVGDVSNKRSRLSWGGN